MAACQYSVAWGPDFVSLPGANSAAGTLCHDIIVRMEIAIRIRAVIKQTEGHYHTLGTTNGAANVRMWPTTTCP